MRPGPDAPVVALDIDGTSGDYHRHFTWFAEQYTGKEMPNPLAYSGGVPFHKHLGLSRTTYNQVKLAYRQGGLKRFMPVYDGIGTLTHGIRKAGVQVWICTTRPYLNLSNIDPDTRHWLTKRAGIQYDGLLYGEHKYRDLVKAVGAERVVLVYEDLPKLVEQALSLGLPACLRAQPYNSTWAAPSSGKVWDAHTVSDMWGAFRIAHDEWRSKHE